MADTGGNAVGRRLAEVEAGWSEFLASGARLSVWRADGEDLEFLHAFLAAEGGEAGRTPDLFIRLASPFAQGRAYAPALARELSGLVSGAGGELAELGLPATWEAPPPRPGETGPAHFARVATDLHARYATAMEALALVLDPDGVSDPAAWQAWLLDLARLGGQPEPVRYLAFDSRLAPAWPLLAREPGERVQVRDWDLDLPGARAELAGAGEDGPGPRFRRALVALGDAAAKGDLAGTRAKGDEALAIAATEGWPELETAAHMALGAARLRAGDLPGCLESYRNAQVTSAAAEGAGHPAGPKLRLQARMAEGAALAGSGRHGEAAPLYAEAAPRASAQGDMVMAMECWRMSAYCRERLGQWEAAWRAGQEGAKLATGLDAGARRQSALAHLGLGMIRIARQAPYPGQDQAVRRRFAELLGPDWEAGAKGADLAEGA